MRDADGLALSSRNGYLSDAQRAEAAQLHGCLSKLAAAVRSGRTDWQKIESEAREFLSARGWQPDYVAIRRQSDLREPSTVRRWSRSRPRGSAAPGSSTIWSYDQLRHEVGRNLASTLVRFSPAASMPRGTPR